MLQITANHCATLADIFGKLHTSDANNTHSIQMWSPPDDGYPTTAKVTSNVREQWPSPLSPRQPR